MTVKLAISGQRDEGDLRATRGGPPGAEAPVTDLLDAVEVVESFDLSPSARARTDLKRPSRNRSRTTTCSRSRSKAASKSGPRHSATARTSCY